MGMSSSQARLLTLTGRMHDIEYKAAKIEAQKLQMANESRRVYDDYLNALDKRKVQYQFIQTNGTTAYRDVNCNILQNGCVNTWTGEKMSEVLFLQKQDGTLLVTPAVAEKFNLKANPIDDMDPYIIATTGETKSERDVVVGSHKENTSKVSDVSVVENHKDKDFSTGYTFEGTVANILGDEDFQIPDVVTTFSTTGASITYSEDPGSHSYIPSVSSISTSYDSSVTTYAINNAADLFALADLFKTSYSRVSGKTFVLNADIDLSEYKDSNGEVISWAGISNFNGTFDGNYHTISNLTGSAGLIKNSSGGATDFENKNRVTVKNLLLEDVNIDSAAYYTGGIIGYTSVDTTISNCSVTGKMIFNKEHCGGIVGKTGEAKNVTIENCNVNLDIECNGSTVFCIGGIVGHGENVGYYTAVGDDGKTHYVNADGEIISSGTSGRVTNYNYVTDADGNYLDANGNIVYTRDSEGNYHNVTNDRIVTSFDKAAIDYSTYGMIVINNCTSTGTIHGGYRDGGIVGHNHNAHTQISNCMTNMKSIPSTENGNIGAAIGESNRPESYDIDNVTYDSDNGNLKLCGNQDNEAFGFRQTITIPSINADYSGEFYSNLYGMLVKANNGDMSEITEENIKNYIKNLKNSEGGDYKLANLNDYIYKYLNPKNNPSYNVGSELAQSIFDDIKENKTDSFANITGNYNINNHIIEYSSTNNTWQPQSYTSGLGKYTIPSVSTMAQELFYMANKFGQNIDLEQINQWFDNQYDTSKNVDRQYLANLNDLIATKNESVINGILSKIVNGEKISNTNNYPIDKYEIGFASDTVPSVEYEQRVVLDTEKEKYWDTTNPKIANAMAMWIIAHNSQIEVITEDNAKSSEYLVNMLESGDAVLTTFDPKNMARLDGLSETEALNLSEQEYNDMMGIVNTSVSIETKLQEVPDEIELRKAEAKYEADMKRIDRKDSFYDKELAALDNERNAIKQEMETLKTVAKDNVERTFKLFG